MGETPVIEHPYKRDKISLISGVSVSPQQQRLGLYYLLFYDNIGQEEVILFLRELLRHLRGQVMVLLDNSTIHKGEPIEELFSFLCPRAESGRGGLVSSEGESGQWL